MILVTKMILKMDIRKIFNADYIKYLKKDGFDERVNSRCESRVPVFLEESGSPEAPQEDSTFAEDREEVQHLQIVSNTFQKKM